MARDGNLLSSDRQDVGLRAGRGSGERRVRGAVGGTETCGSGAVQPGAIFADGEDEGGDDSSAGGDNFRS